MSAKGYQVVVLVAVVVVVVVVKRSTRSPQTSTTIHQITLKRCLTSSPLWRHQRVPCEPIGRHDDDDDDDDCTVTPTVSVLFFLFDFTIAWFH
jgi:hypothetical protein